MLPTSIFLEGGLSRARPATQARHSSATCRATEALPAGSARRPADDRRGPFSCKLLGAVVRWRSGDLLKAIGSAPPRPRPGTALACRTRPGESRDAAVRGPVEGIHLDRVPARWLPLGSALEAAALGLAAGVTLAVAGLVAGCRTPSGSEVSERAE